jgi:hypothetical protein
VRPGETPLAASTARVDDSPNGHTSNGARRAFLKAKQIGRDRVVVAGEPIETKPAELAATVVVGPAAHN